MLAPCLSLYKTIQIYIESYTIPLTHTHTHTQNAVFEKAAFTLYTNSCMCAFCPLTRNVWRASLIYGLFTPSPFAYPHLLAVADTGSTKCCLSFYTFPDNDLSCCTDAFGWARSLEELRSAKWRQFINTIIHNNNNRPDIIVKNQREKRCIPIDVAIPADRNVTQKEAEKKLNTRVCV